MSLTHKIYCGRRRTPKYRKTVALIVAIIVLINLFIQYGVYQGKQREQGKVYAAESTNEVLSYKFNSLQEQNQALQDKLDQSLKFNTPENVKALSRVYIKKYFGEDAERVEKVMTCESGLNPQTVHTNKPGLGVDRGLYQINDKYHKTRFEKMFNVPFEIGAHDLEMSSKYARYLYDHSKLNAWVCNKIV